MFLIDVAFPCDLHDIHAARSALAERRRDLGRFGPRQIAVCACLGLAVVAWAIMGPAHIAVVALSVSVLLLGSGLVRWRDLAAQVPWDLLLLYGSALALAKALEETGAHRLAADHVLPFISGSPLLAVGVVACLAMFLTEAMSNAAVVSVLVPLLLGMSANIGLAPEHAALAVALPAGLAFMLPMGSPPLAIAFASGEFRLPTMALWGFLLNLIAIPLTVLAARFIW
jgi:sodium-dependent dicarboxylate transporter 2/3/5